MIMKKYLPLLILPFLVSCGGAEEEVVTLREEPPYCIRNVVILNDDPRGTVLLDMPGYPYGMTDAYQEVSKDLYNTLDVPVCAYNDPRMSVQPSGIAWADGRDTGLDELPSGV